VPRPSIPPSNRPADVLFLVRLGDSFVRLGIIRSACWAEPVIEESCRTRSEGSRNEMLQGIKGPCPMASINRQSLSSSLPSKPRHKLLNTNNMLGSTAKVATLLVWATCALTQELANCDGFRQPNWDHCKPTSPFLWSQLTLVHDRR
jgi:hypothetical protein